jgi:hypothetical protein
MTTVYDPDLWLESLTRALSDFCGAYLDDPDSDVEMSFPDTSTWTKRRRSRVPVVHFEIDDISTPILGFGNPGRDVFDDVNGTVVHQEVQQHDVNFDVGVWVSAETGGATKRMELVRKLKDMFTSATYKKILSEQYNGISVLLFDGGTNMLDRINDVPLWRHPRTTFTTDTTYDSLNTLLIKDQLFLDIAQLLYDDDVLRHPNNDYWRSFVAASVTTYLARRAAGVDAWITAPMLPSGSQGFGVTVTPDGTGKQMNIAWQAIIDRGTQKINVNGVLSIAA